MRRRAPWSMGMGYLLAVVVVMGIKHDATQAAVPELLVTDSEKAEFEQDGWSEMGLGQNMIHLNQTIVLDAGVAVVEMASPLEEEEEMEVKPLSRSHHVAPRPTGVPTIRMPIEDHEDALRKKAAEEGEGGAAAASHGSEIEEKGEGDGSDIVEGQEEENDEEAAAVAEASLKEMMRAIGEEEEERKKEAEEVAQDDVIAKQAEKMAEEEKAAKAKLEKQEAAEKERRKERPPLGVGEASPFSGLGGGGRFAGLSGGAPTGGVLGGMKRTRVPLSSGGSSAEMASMFQAQQPGGGFGGGGGGQASFESILEMQEKNVKHGVRYEDDDDRPGLRRARMDARMVLEADAFMHGAFAPRVASPFEDGEEGTKGEGVSGGGSSSGSVGAGAAASQWEVSRIMKEGNREVVNHYSVLGVSRRAPQQKIKERFRTLVLQVHPDKCNHRDAHEAFQLVQEAYESLSSPLERRKYDQFLVKLRAKRWRKRIRPIIDYLDEWSDWTDPVVNNRRTILAAIIVWVLFL